MCTLMTCLSHEVSSLIGHNTHLYLRVLSHCTPHDDLRRIFLDFSLCPTSHSLRQKENHDHDFLNDLFNHPLKS